MWKFCIPFVISIGGTVFDYLQQRNGQLLSEKVIVQLILFSYLVRLFIYIYLCVVSMHLNSREIMCCCCCCCLK